jgi:Ca2+-binding EF-hand superfamily protein
MRLLVLSTALVLAAAPALAASERAGGYGMMPEFDFEAADTDGDGALSREEFTAYVETRIETARDARLERHAEAIMEAGDADGDGALTLDELRAGLAAVHAERMERHSAWRERRAERAERGSERRGQRGMRHGRMHGGDRSEMIDRMFDRIDTDDDGTISPEELEAAQARWEERAERRGHRRGE